MKVSQFEQIAVAEFVRQVGNEHGWGLQFDHVAEVQRWGVIIVPPRQHAVILLFLEERTTADLTRDGVKKAVAYCRAARTHYN
jgi:hypothetical protein